jgi:predicted small lipoprotein YifL
VRLPKIPTTVAAALAALAASAALLGCGGSGAPYVPPDAGSSSNCPNAQVDPTFSCYGLFNCGRTYPGKCCDSSARYYCPQSGCMATEAEAAAACAGTGNRCQRCVQEL